MRTEECVCVCLTVCVHEVSLGTGSVSVFRQHHQLFSVKL